MKTFVSLLPPEIKSKRLLNRKLNNIFAGITVVLLVMLVAYAALFISGLKLRSDLRALRNVRAAVEEEAAALEEYALLYDQLTAAEAVIGEAMGNVPHWSDFLQDLSYHLPPAVWLMELTADYSSEGGKIKLRGWAYEHSDVAAMLERLYTLEKLKEVRCQVSLASVLGGEDVVQFYVEAELVDGLPYLEALEGGGEE